MVSRHVHALFRPTITLYPNFSRPFQRTSPCFTTAAFAGESFPHLEDGFIATGTIITHSVDNTTPDNLIAQIPNLQWKFKSNAAEPLALFLLTPSFATWLLDDKTFLEKALHKAYRRTIRARAMYPTRIHAVVAVVDRLPAPSSAVLDQLQPPSSTTGSPSTGARSISLPSLYSGHEGIAYAFMRHSSMLSTIRQGPTEDTNGAHDNGSSTISIHAPYEFYTPSKSPQDSSTCNTIVQFPLANTVFQTGCSSTMFSSVWDIPIEKITALAEKTRLKHLSISWPFNLPSKATVSIPLIPLTVPRKIEAGMGNIIRRILGPGSKSMTASQELEETVPKYFKAQGIPPQAMKVWALLIPETALSSIHGILSELLAQPATGSVDMSSSFQTLWKSNLPLRNEIVSYALSKGARLHRVLSGGGGWGKKAGLLSLDPDQFYGSTLSPRTSGLDINDILEEIPSGFHEVAKSGEFVQFFVSPSEFVPTYQNHHNNLNSTRGNSPTLHSLELGTIPSSIDSIPTSRIPKDVLQSTIPKVSVFQNHFGVLSEGGINIHALRQNETGGPWKTQTKTKIDVPFSRYSSLGAALRKTKLLVRRCKNESSPYIRKIITSKSLVNVIEHSHPIAIESQISERNRVEPSLRIRRIPSDSPLVKVYVSQSGETSVGAKPPCSQSVQNSKGNPSTTVAFQFVQNPKPTSSTSAQMLPELRPPTTKALVAIGLNTAAHKFSKIQTQYLKIKRILNHDLLKMRRRKTDKDHGLPFQDSLHSCLVNLGLLGLERSIYNLPQAMAMLEKASTLVTQRIDSFRRQITHIKASMQKHSRPARPRTFLRIGRRKIPYRKIRVKPPILPPPFIHAYPSEYIPPKKSSAPVVRKNSRIPINPKIRMMRIRRMKIPKLVIKKEWWYTRPRRIRYIYKEPREALPPLEIRRQPRQVGIRKTFNYGEGRKRGKPLGWEMYRNVNRRPIGYRARSTDPEAQKLVDQVEGWLRGF